MTRRLSAVALLVTLAACTEKGDETFLFRPSSTRQAVTGTTPIDVRERWLAYLADELTTGPGGSDFNGDTDTIDQIAVLVNMVAEHTARLDVAAQEVAVIGKHLYLVTDESADDDDWNNDGDELDLVLLHTACEGASSSTVGFVATLARTGPGPRMLKSENERLFFVEDPTATPLAGAETSLDMIRLSSAGAPLAPERLLNEAGNATLQPRLAATEERIVFALLDETVEGGDLNGDGDASDNFVLALLDSLAANPEVKSTRLAMSGAAAPLDALDISSGETLVAFLVDETAQGAGSLNNYSAAFANWRPAHCLGNDTDASDEVLHFLWFDTWFAGVTTPRNTGFAGADRVLLTTRATSSYVGSIVPEADDQNCSGQGGLNDDGDATDRVLRWIKVEASLGSSGVFSDVDGLVALADTPGGTHGVAQINGRWIAVIDEADDSRDWDGQVADHEVVAWLDPGQGNAADWITDHCIGGNCGGVQAGGASWMGELPGARVGIGFQEAVFGLSINGRDNDLTDSVPVFARFDPQDVDDFDFPGPAVAVDEDNVGTVIANGVAFYRVDESDDNFDWNDDGDKSDRILFRTTVATLGDTFEISTLNNLTRPAVVTDTRNVGAAFIADEAAARADLDQDGDQNDFVVRWMRIGP
jgi:hypothetical protein